MKLKTLMLGMLAVLSVPSTLLAQNTSYSQTNLVANTAGVAKNTDQQLSNPWGISFIPGQAFWIANNNGGTSTLYDAQGNKQTLVVGIPSASMNPCTPGCPTGTVANGNASNFNGGAFQFDTEDGIIANWTGLASAVVAVDNSPAGAVYKGLALVTNASGTFLLAANFNSGKIDVFDVNFHPANLAGSFTDPKLPAGFAPHGIHLINNVIYVTYGMQNSAKHDPVPGAGLGVVDTFDTNGNFLKTLVTGGKLNAPWGVVATPASFGTFSNALLIGNFGDGTMNAYDNQGNFLGQVSDSTNTAIVNPGLWDMVFGAGGTGDPNTLYFTAGGPNQTSGLFATLIPAAAATGADFSLNVSAASQSVSPGGSATVSVTAAAVGGFNSQITLTCSSAAGITCAFAPSMIAPGTTSTLTISAAMAPPPTGYTAPAMMALLPGLGIFGTLVTTGKSKLTAKARKRLLWISAFFVLALCLVAVGCSGSSSSNHQTGSTPVNLVVTGTSGALTHSQTVAITVK